MLILETLTILVSAPKDMRSVRTHTDAIVKTHEKGRKDVEVVLEKTAANVMTHLSALLKGVEVVIVATEIVAPTLMKGGNLDVPTARVVEGKHH